MGMIIEDEAEGEDADAGRVGGGMVERCLGREEATAVIEEGA